MTEVAEDSTTLDVEARCDLVWYEKLPLISLGVEVGYPDFTQPRLADGAPNIRFHASGLRLMEGKEDPDRSMSLVRWTRENRGDLFRFKLLKLAEPVQGWDPNEIVIRKTLAFDPSDSRVELANGVSALSIEERTQNHSVTVDEKPVRCFVASFALINKIPNDAVSVTLSIMLGGRTDVRQISKTNQRNIVWELFSDKYSEEREISYELQVTVVGQNIDDEPVRWGSSNPTRADMVESGFDRFIPHQLLQIPPPPAERIDTINRYIREFYE